MAKQKATTKAAAKTAVKKKWTGVGTSANLGAQDHQVEGKGRAGRQIQDH